MKAWGLLPIVALVVAIGSCTKTVELEKIIKDVVPQSIDIDKYPDAKQYLIEEVEACGPGVIEGAKTADGTAYANKCAHTVKVDQELVESFTFRKGLLHDESIFQQDGVHWYEAGSQFRNVPETFNVMDLMKGSKPVPGNQGKCGSCWAYSTHQGWEIVRAIAEGKFTDLSAQTILSCSDIDAKNWGCNGGTMDVVKFIKRGVPVDSEFPYVARKVVCKYSTAQLNDGWPPKAIETPWVGKSLSHSRYWKATGQLYADGKKVQNIMAAMYQQKSPAIATVAAFSVSGSQVYSSCSAINSGGDHMVNLSGWGKNGSDRVADVYNSWGAGFGVGGIGKIKWECGEGKLNRGLGVEARVIQYAPPCQPPEPYIGKAHHQIIKGSSVKLGKKQAPGVTCSWSPATGVHDPSACETFVTPEKSTEYHLTAQNGCATVSAMTLIDVLAPTRGLTPTILTPYGEIKR